MSLKYLFASVLLLGQLSFFATTQSIETNICGLPGTPVIVSPATNETTATQDLTVNGTADDNVTINILDNSSLLASVTADSSGNYGATIALSSGSNQIIAQAENNCSQTANSSSVTVTYSPPTPPPSPPSSSGSSSQTTVTVPPVVPVAASKSSSGAAQATVSVPVATPLPALRLSLNVSKTSAGSGSSSGSSGNTVPLGKSFMTSFYSVFITGNTGRLANVEVLDGQTVVANIQTDDSGNFGVRIPLKIGDNILSFVIKSEGQTITKTVHIIRKAVPLPAKGYSLKRVLLYSLATIVIVEVVCFLVLLLVYRHRRGNNS